MPVDEYGIQSVNAEELQGILESQERNVIVIDVREPEEYEHGHIPGIPLIPMNTIPDVVDELDPQQTYIFVCRSGRRSWNIASYLQDKGFAKVFNFSGGMLGWMGPIKEGMEK